MDKDTIISNPKTRLRSTVDEWALQTKSSDQTYPLVGEMTIGREGCDILLSGDHASRKHAKITIDENKVVLEDMGSTNGTYVNDERIDKTELAPGDELRFDEEVFVIIGPEEEPEQTDDNKTVLRPKEIVEEQTEPVALDEEKPQVDDKPEQVKSSPIISDQVDQVEQVKSAAPAADDNRGAWYERETAQGTAKVSTDMRDQFAENGTRIVRSVGKVDMPSLVGTNGDWAGQIITLESESTTVGRSDTDIVIDEPSISTKHARIIREGNTWKVTDLMSANGVYVNGKKTQVSFLSEGDAVRFGRLEFRFVVDTTNIASRANPQEETLIESSGKTSSGMPSWMYLAIGFLVVLGIGAYILLAK